MLERWILPRVAGRNHPGCINLVPFHSHVRRFPIMGNDLPSTYSEYTDLYCISPISQNIRNTQKYTLVQRATIFMSRHESVQMNGGSQLPYRGWSLSTCEPLKLDMSKCLLRHSLLVTFVTFLLLASHADSTSVELWAGFLGITSALSAVMQYFPQIELTWRRKLVGALSIPMMCIQSPGAVLMVISIAIR